MSKLNWNIETAKDAKLTGKIDDTIWIIYARKHNRIGITFDELQKEQGIKVIREIRKHGGKVIRLQGGPEQNKYCAFGKLIYHYKTWHNFFDIENNNGVCVIGDIDPQHCKTYTPELYHQKYHPVDAKQFTDYLNKRKTRIYKPRKRKPHIPPKDQITSNIIESQKEWGNLPKMNETSIQPPPTTT